jgi:periplasmic divalent cation tolerance protein
MNNSYSVIMTTFPNQESLEKVSSKLLESGLAACIQYFDVTSMFSWEGKINKEPEKLLLIKTKSSLFDEIKAFITKEHPYDVPEIIQVPIEKMAEAYQLWMESVLKKSES